MESLFLQKKNVTTKMLSLVMDARVLVWKRIYGNVQLSEMERVNAHILVEMVFMKVHKENHVMMEILYLEMVALLHVQSKLDSVAEHL